MFLRGPAGKRQAGLCAGSQAGAAKPRHCLVNGTTTTSPCRARREPLYEGFKLHLNTNRTGRIETKLLLAVLSSSPAGHASPASSPLHPGGPNTTGMSGRRRRPGWVVLPHPFQIEVSPGLFEQRPQPISSPQAFCTCDALQLRAALTLHVGEPHT